MILKPCPVCEDVEPTHQSTTVKHPDHWIICRCGFEGPKCPSESGAETVWNSITRKRAEPQSKTGLFWYYLTEKNEDLSWYERLVAAQVASGMIPSEVYRLLDLSKRQYTYIVEKREVRPIAMVYIRHAIARHKRKSA